MAATKKCIICGKAKRANQFLKHKNTWLADDFTICRDCANEKADFTDEKSVIMMCQLANIPYVKTLVVEVMKENDHPTFGMYMRKIAPYKRYISFADSVFDSEEELVNETFKVTNEVQQRWGTEYDKEKYIYFDSALKGLNEIKPATTSLEMERYVQNVKLKDVLNEALKSGDFKAITQLRKSYNDDLKELGFDSVLNSKDNSSETIGQRIQKYEMIKPVPDREEYDDASGIKRYVEKWFIIPLKRTFGLADEKEVASLYEEE